MKSQLYKKIGSLILIGMFFVGQTHAAAPVIDVLRELQEALRKAGGRVLVSDMVAKGEKAITQAANTLTACSGAQQQIARDAAGLSAETFLSGVLGLPPVITDDELARLAQSEKISKSQMTLIATCKEATDAAKTLTTSLNLAASQVASASNETVTAAKGALELFQTTIFDIQARIDRLLDSVKQEKIAAEQKKSRQLIQFDQILKKITERMKLALTEKIKSTILDTLQNSGAPRWITNWSTRYANTYMNAYQQKYQEARIEEVQKGNLIRQRVLNAPSYESIGQIKPSVDPTVPMSYLLRGRIMKLLDTPGIPATFALETHKKATAAGENKVNALEKQDGAYDGYLPKVRCKKIEETIQEIKSDETITKARTQDKMFQKWDEYIRSDSAPYLQQNNRLTSNTQLLRPNYLNKTAVEAGKTVAAVRNPTVSSNSQSGIQQIVGTVDDPCPGGEEEVVTPGGTYADMSKELMGIDIKQMLNNTIEEWMNSFLENSIICKISGTACGKTADIGAIAKQQLLGQLSQYGNSLSTNNPIKDLIEQIVSQGGSLDGVFGSSRDAQVARDQLSQYGNSLPNGDPMKETIDQIVSAGNSSSNTGGTLSDISIGGNTNQTSGKIDCSIFTGSAKSDCETAAGLFDTNKELQKQMLDESIKNLDMPGRLSRATENLNTISTKLNQVKTIYESIAKCVTDNQKMAKDTIPLIEDMINDNLATKEMLQNVKDSMDQFKNSSPEKLETLMQHENQFLESIDSTMTEIENTNIPRYFTSVRTWLSQIVKFNTTLKIEVEGISTTIPANINVANGCQQSPFTTDTSGTLFVQTLTQKEYTLQDFFGAWGRTFTQNQLFNLPPVNAFRELTMSVNNTPSTEFQALKLQSNQNILIKYTTKPPGTCIDGKLIDGSACPVQQQACRTSELNPPTCIRQPWQTCIPSNNQLFCF